MLNSRLQDHHFSTIAVFIALSETVKLVLVIIFILMQALLLIYLRVRTVSFLRAHGWHFLKNIFSILADSLAKTLGHGFDFQTCPKYANLRRSTFRKWMVQNGSGYFAVSNLPV